MKYTTNDVPGSKSCVILEPYLGFVCLAFFIVLYCLSFSRLTLCYFSG